MGQRKPNSQELLRLDAIADHLGVKQRYPQPGFTPAVVAACRTRIEPILATIRPCKGEEIAAVLGNHFCVTFEEVRGSADVEKIEDRYLRGKREIGFAQLRDELEQPGVDALLFERIHALPRDPDRWVAVLNLQANEARAYWDRFHALAHRVAEPSQGILPFRRHQFEATSPL